jgi:ADP-ribose pyrophosphatase YjhB (NUDIX family)
MGKRKLYKQVNSKRKMDVVQEFLSTVYIVNDNKVLLTWNKKVNNWIPIGRHIQQNELPCNSVVREAKEESNLDIELVSLNKKSSDNLPQPVSIHLDHISDDHKHINLTYFASVKSGECFKFDDEGKELKWFSKEEIEQDTSLLPNIKEYALKALKHLGSK